MSVCIQNRLKELDYAWIATDLHFTWWQKLIKLPQMANVFRDRLIMEDISIMENFYARFNKKITLKNDTPAELAMNYLQTWDDQL